MRQMYAGAMECLIVDDCGTDESISIAERVIAEYEGPIRFEILHHDHNRGLSAARNTGTLAARGDFIFYLDSDDFISDDCISILMAVAMRDPAIEMVQGRFCLCDSEKCYPFIKEASVVHAITNHDVWESLFLRYLIVTASWNKLVKRSFILDHDLLFKEGLLFEDGLWQFYTMKYISNVVLVPDITYHYRKRPGSICTSTDKATAAYHKSIIYQDILVHLTPDREKEEFKFYARQLSVSLIRFGCCCPEIKDVFVSYWKTAKQLKCFSSRVVLRIGYVLGKYKYGWMIIPVVNRLRHPAIIRNDFRQYWRRIGHNKNPWPKASDISPSKV